MVWRLRFFEFTQTLKQSQRIDSKKIHIELKDDYNITIPYISPTILISPLEFFSQLCYSIQDRAINV